jgi:hypothetical protein
MFVLVFFLAVCCCFLCRNCIVCVLTSLFLFFSKHFLVSFSDFQVRFRPSLGWSDGSCTVPRLVLPLATATATATTATATAANAGADEHQRHGGAGAYIFGGSTSKERLSDVWQ